MHTAIQQLAERIDGLVLRQRIMLLLAGLALLFLVGDTLAIQPALQQQKVLRQAITDWQLRLDILRERTGLLGEDPDSGTRSGHADMLARLARLDTRINDQLGGLLAPEQAVEVLKQVLQQEKDLKLLEVTAVSMPLAGDDPPESEPSAASIGRYHIELRLQGDYLATLRYLRALENLSWKFFWESVEFEVTSHPQAWTTLAIYTLGPLGEMP